MINIAKGGTLYQDVHKQIDSSILQHRQKSCNSHPTHHINITDNSLLHRIVNKSILKVNSRHHQAVKDVGDGLRVSAKAPDGIVEAIEGKNEEAFILGVQWHPENMLLVDDKDAQQIFENFVSAITNRH